ncbi:MULTISPECIES: bacillithiol system redox-active protein YtxJ [Psychrobacillus]|uniref:Bacillithiol system redox-active protein YtxJ n=1 Tax=Psychrobacillus faecigallinarum TaxID=2762235 RepID=A0ABR8R5S8_9BACI|nr:bacillithiol system redox-active protein YtxJ [Psychrobacillus faecigallinarum]MBD7943145.1 bacillithiol system redox-active protein YtxJ [Psychrobacillus faecigallinarum]QGM31131.1 bacillithiol system redox-active protein YtxJ [Bacillus sp. N3536]
MSNFKEITNIEEWKDVLEQSKSHKLLLLKHSTTCPVSAHAYAEFTSFESPVEKYLVKVIESRAVSNEIEHDLGVKHESPQSFLIVDGKASWGASHWKITKKELANATESF